VKNTRKQQSHALYICNKMIKNGPKVNTSAFSPKQQTTTERANDNYNNMK